MTAHQRAHPMPGIVSPALFSPCLLLPRKHGKTQGTPLGTSLPPTFSTTAIALKGMISVEMVGLADQVHHHLARRLPPLLPLPSPLPSSPAIKTTTTTKEMARVSQPHQTVLMSS